jgi:hypothetical protein
LSEEYLKVQSVQSEFGKWAAVAVGGVGLILLGSAALISRTAPDPVDFTKLIKFMEESKIQPTFEEIHSLITDPFRTQLTKIFVLIGVGIVCIGMSLCCLNQTAHDLFFRLGRRMSVGLSGSGLILIALVIIFAVVAIPISFRTTSQFFLDLAKVGFGAFLAMFVQGHQPQSDQRQPAAPTSEQSEPAPIGAALPPETAKAADPEQSRAPI